MAISILAQSNDCTPNRPNRTLGTPLMKSTRVNEIDLLRFISAIAVVFHHYAFRGYYADSMTVMPYPLLAPASKYGNLGVEFFFMISGFVILMTAANGSLKAFVISRMVRLYPAFWACCTATFLVTLAIGGERYSATLTQYLANMTMLSGFTSTPSMDGAYWSLFVEIRFYAIVAIVLMLGGIKHFEKIQIIWLASTIALEFHPIPKLRYLLIADYSAFFIAGATHFLIWSKGLSKDRIIIILITWILSLKQTISGLPAFESYYNTSVNRFIVGGIITLFFITLTLVSLRKTGWFGKKQWITLGSLTYPLYLIHQNIGYMAFNALYPEINSHILFWGAIAGSIAFAYAVHRFVERNLAPFMKEGLSRMSKRPLRI